MTAKGEKVTNGVMKKENVDYVLNTNLKKRILDENKNVNIENQNWNITIEFQEFSF